MKSKLKAVKRAKLFFYAIIQVLTATSLSAYSWRPNLPLTSNENWKLVKHSFSDTSMIDNFTKSSLQSTIAEVHAKFAAKYANIKSSYPETSEKNQALFTTFAMSEITEPSNSFYPVLLQQIQSIISNNITNEQFYYNDNVAIKALTEKGMNIPNYLPERKRVNLGGTQGIIQSAYVFNTLTSDEQKLKITKLLGNIKEYLIKSKDDYEMEWYSKIPEELKIKIGFNEAISNQNYTNLIDALTTKKNSGTIVETGYQLSTLQTKINELLKTQMNADIQKIKTAVQDKAVPLFLDQTPEEFALIFNFTSAQIQNFGLNGKQWNYYFSQPSLIELNPQALSNGLSELKLYNSKFFYGSDNTNKIESPKLSFLLAINNGFYPNNFSDSARDSSDIETKYYENNDQINAQELLNKLFNFIKNDIIKNFSSYFVFKASSKTKAPNTITHNDFDETDKLKKLKKLLNLELSFTGQPSKDRVADPFGERTWNAEVTLKLSSNDILKTPKHQKTGTFNVQIVQKQNEAQADFERALELEPIFERKYASTPKTTIINEINRGEQKYFKFNNQQPNLEYKTNKAEQLANGDVKLTIQIASLAIPSLRKTYEKIVDKSFFVTSDTFDIKAYDEAQKINTAARQKYGDAIYSAKMNNPAAEELFFQKVLLATKTSTEFQSLTFENKLNLFKSNYQKALLGLLLNQTGIPKNELTEKINNYYEDLSKRLDTLFQQAGISPESELAKSLKAQIAKAHENALNDKANFNQNNPINQELADILNILNSKDIDQNLVNNFGKFIEKYNYNDIQKVLSQTQKSVLYSVSGLAGIILLGSSYLMFRSMKIDAQRYRIRKSMLGTLSGFLILASGASLIYLIVYLLGAV